MGDLQKNSFFFKVRQLCSLYVRFVQEDAIGDNLKRIKWAFEENIMESCPSMSIPVGDNHFII